MHAYKLKRIDNERDMHIQAWLNYQVQATKPKGKKTVPVYKNFKDFYDYDKNIREIEGNKETAPKVSSDLKKKAHIAKMLNKGG